MDSLTLEGGKYTIQQLPDGTLTSLRYGEAWRPLTGDKLACAMFDRIKELEAALTIARAKLDDEGYFPTPEIDKALGL